MKENITADEFLARLKEKNILGGVKITLTEFNEESDIVAYLKAL